MSPSYSDDVVLFTACGANELAAEIGVNVKGSVEAYGALSFFFYYLVDHYLKKGGQTYENLGLKVKALVKAAGVVGQTPEVDLVDERMNVLFLSEVMLSVKAGDDLNMDHESCVSEFQVLASKVSVL